MLRFVPDDKVEPMLKHVMQLHGQQMGYSAMVPELSQYWPKGKLKNGLQLRSYLDNIYRRSECPEFFKKWVDAGKPPAGVKGKGKISKGKKRLFSKQDLEKILIVIQDKRNAGKSYGDIVGAIQEYWPEGKRPKTGDQASKFTFRIARSSQCPTWFKNWYHQNKTRFVEPKPVVKKKASSQKAAPADVCRCEKQAKITVRQRVLQIEVNDLKNQLTHLKDIFASCQKLVEVGAIDVAETLRIAMVYLDRI